MSDIPNLKKKLSVDLARAIEKPLSSYYGLFVISDKKDSNLLNIHDKDQGSDLYFTIIKETYDSNGHYIHYSCKPFNTSKKDAASTTTKLESFVNILTHWLENLKFYEEKSVLNDPLIRNYRDEFYADFKIAEEDADTSGFNYSQQQQLSAFFEHIAKEIETVQDDRNKELIAEIKSEVTILQDTVASETKNGLMKKFSLVIAKARKGSMKVCNFILTEFAKEFLKEGAKFAFNYAKENAHKLPEYLNHVVETIKKSAG